jgi:hypothetical protein
LREVGEKGPYLPDNPDRIGLLAEDEVVEAAARRQPRLWAGEFPAQSGDFASDSLRKVLNCLLNKPDHFATNA